MNRHEGQIPGGRGHERGEQHAARQIVLIRHFEREYCTGGGRLEDRGNARRGAGDHKHSTSLRRQHTRESAVQHVAHTRPEVQRRPLESHRRAASEGRDAGDHAGYQRPQGQRVVGVMERVQIFVGG